MSAFLVRVHDEANEPSPQWGTVSKGGDGFCLASPALYTPRERRISLGGRHGRRNRIVAPPMGPVVCGQIGSAPQFHWDEKLRVFGWSFSAGYLPFITIYPNQSMTSER